MFWKTNSFWCLAVSEYILLIFCLVYNNFSPLCAQYEYCLNTCIRSYEAGPSFKQAWRQKSQRSAAFPPLLYG